MVFTVPHQHVTVMFAVMFKVADCRPATMPPDDGDADRKHKTAMAFLFILGRAA